MRRIRVAQIGTSRYGHGNSIFQAMVKQPDVFEIVGYAMPEHEKEKFPGHMELFLPYPELTLEQVLNDPAIEAVTVETEEIYLTKYALMAAEHGKHIQMEKPGGESLEMFERLIETVRRAGKIFHTGYMYRYNPYVLELMEQVKNGELGDIISVEAQMNCYHIKEVRQWLENFPGGMMFFLGSHLIDLIFSIQGTPKKIIPLNMCSGVEGVTSNDFGMVAFEYEKGISFAKTSAVELGGFERRQLVVSGTKKTVELNPLEWYIEDGRLFTERYVRENSFWFKKAEKERSQICDRYDTMIRSFGEMVLGEKENPWNYDYELALYKTLLKACGNI